MIDYSIFEYHDLGSDPIERLLQILPLRKVNYSKAYLIVVLVEVVTENRDGARPQTVCIIIVPWEVLADSNDPSGVAC